MPWKASSVMEQKLGFILSMTYRNGPMTELYERYEIARETVMWGFADRGKPPAARFPLLPQTQICQPFRSSSTIDPHSHWSLSGAKKCLSANC
jgi:hypothetical protein